MKCSTGEVQSNRMSINAIKARKEVIRAHDDLIRFLGKRGRGNQ